MAKMRTFSPMDDPLPFETPKFETLPEERVERKVTGIDKKQIDEYVKGRIDYFDKYLPNGDAILDKNPEEIGRWWQMAATIKAEFEQLNRVIQTGVIEEEQEDDQQPTPVPAG